MILITGDALSGQRRDAESLLNSFVSATYIATSRISDNQIAARIQHHRDTRLAHWRLEERSQTFFRDTVSRISPVTVGGGCG